MAQWRLSAAKVGGVLLTTAGAFVAAHRLAPTAFSDSESTTTTNNNDDNVNTVVSFAEEVDRMHNKIAQDNSVSRLIFLGSGSSSTNPVAYCLTTDHCDEERCRIAKKALSKPPEESKNFRLNPSVLIHQVDAASGKDTMFQIDVGKTFRESLVRWCVKVATSSSSSSSGSRSSSSDGEHV